MSLNDFLNRYPSTNARLFTSVVLDIVFVVTALFCMVRKIDVDSNIIWSLGTFLLVLSGLDATQFNIKRKTEIVTPPEAMAGNTTTSTVTTTASAKVAPVLTRKDAQVAAELLETKQRELADMEGA